ncbi:Bestrophin, RFP-TM, chloride channel-domain-containing protein [Coprinopsis sp. MPI-PUGE-AT-0042]|nr:Bestrophin, RFP-TM, chloride channel-domain-containing protein [Coprinopsis sp. MPI-PUGE-AT-0042]
MVANNPLFRGRWNAKRFQATVVNDIWPEVAFFTAFAAMVACVDQLTKRNMGIPSTLLTVLGTVLGLVISFRTSSAYERYQDGRKMWTNINTACRNLGQMFWLHVSVDRNPVGGVAPPTPLACTIEKKTMMNILQAFPVAVKHFLRGEQGVYYEDLYPLICFLPRYANAEPHHDERLPLWHEETAAEHAKEDADRSNRHDREVTEKSTSRASSRKPRKDNFDPEAALPSVAEHVQLKPARNPPETTLLDYIPLLRLFRWMIRALLKKAQPGEQRRRKKHVTVVESNVPLEITLFLSSYSVFLMKSGLLQPAIATGIMNNIATLQDTLSNLERICNTPLPFAYQAHLRMSLWLYLLFLPFQVVDTMKWITIPGTAFASFLLLGFLEIGQEIENPFNYDLNDLDLDYFCLDIQRQLHEITVHTHPTPADFVFSPLNQPFAPADKRSAEELMALGPDYVAPDADAAPGMNSIRRTLVKSWRNVDILTRKSY